MSDRILTIVCALTAAVTLATAPTPAQAQDIPRWARVSFFTQGASTTPTDGGNPSSYVIFTSNIAAESARHPGGGFQYGLNVHFGTYPSRSGRKQRVSLYDGYVAGGFMGGHLFAKVGQMWLTDLGGLGAVAGGLVEYRQGGDSKSLRWRAGAFGGVEPRPLELGYVDGITKYGGYVALEGNGARRHVVGYVGIRNQGMTERSVLVVTNFVPIGREFFLYQAAEISLSGAGGQGKRGVAYFFVNAHASPTRRLDLQLTYHRGLSIDFRSITDDIINGRPVPARSLDGFLFQSVGGRATVEVVRNLRVFVGYSRDTTGSSTGSTNRLSFGFSSADLFHTGIDVNVSDYRYSGGTSPSYDSWYVSIGRNLSSRIYLSGEYSSSLSVVRFVQSSGVVIESRPSTKRFGGTGIVHVGRRASLLFTFDRTQDTNYTENRFLAGLNVRF